jgi:hypothetical protein
MATRSNVVVAASNAYDWVYLRRSVGVSATPWPGLSTQLSRIAYTGASASGRPEVLFCCGAQAYNRPIAQWAELVANASVRLARAGDASQRYVWLNDIYPKSFHCKREKVREPESADGKKRKKAKAVEQCGYKYEDVASHPLAVLLPYSVHSYGLVQAYAMGLPVVAPSLRLLSTLHTSTGIMGHKGPGNVPWRSTATQPIRTFLMPDPKVWHAGAPGEDAPCCAHEPNDACTPAASASWLQFADWYQWPHIVTYNTPEELVSTVGALLANASRRRETSAAQKAFFDRERSRMEGHVRIAMGRALDAAKRLRAARTAA